MSRRNAESLPFAALRGRALFALGGGALFAVGGGALFALCGGLLFALGGCTPSAPASASPTEVVEPVAAPVARAPAAPAAPLPAAHGAPAPAAPASAAATGAQTFGAPLDPARALTALSVITASPETFKDQVVKTEGEIARVCQAMGCWMELRSTAEAQPVRVPMAGHAFFLPKNAAGRHATIEGRVALQELSPEARAHLAGEGATAVASALSISATTVVID